MTLYCLHLPPTFTPRATMIQNENCTVDLGSELNSGLLFWKTVDT